MYRAPRGTADILPQEQHYWRYVERIAQNLAHRHGFQKIETPVFESTGLFTRTTGEATDIVDKEMYTFFDRGKDEISLRPEGTAPVCRAYLENGMQAWPQPVRLYYFCPIFRYDRPQAGRYRQHHQFGVEVLGEGNMAADIEVIELAWRFFEELGLQGQTLHLNSIGDHQCRPKYLQALVEYYRPHYIKLCVNCKERIDHNPLRLLDCKKNDCSALTHAAPNSTDYLCPPCQNHWSELTQYLDDLEIPYKINKGLVRGLDYYTRTVFEIQPLEEGAQAVLCGGGRYDGLIEQLGGKPTPGVGFATGFERIILNLKRQNIQVQIDNPTLVLLAHMGTNAQRQSIKIASLLRKNNVGTVVAPAGRSLKSQMRYASSLGATFALILGDEEISRGMIVLRNLDLGEQKEIPLSEIVQYMSDRLQNKT